jgi:hypothetical protein
MNVSASARWSYVPLNIWLFYSVSTISVFAFGPLQFPVESKMLLYGYLFVAHIAIIFGYRSGLKKTKHLRGLDYTDNWLNKKIVNLLAVIVLIGIALAFLRDSLSGASIAVATDDAFGARELYTKERSGGVLGYVGAILNSLRVPFLALVTANFTKVSKFAKWILLLLIVRMVYEAVVGSSRSGLMLLIIVLFFSGLALLRTRQIDVSVKKFLLLSTAAVFLFLAFSSYIAIARQTIVIEDFAQYMANNDRYDFDYDNLLMPQFSGGLKFINAGILQGYFYFTHAYAGLSSALNLPFNGTTFLFGHSDFLIRNFARIFGEDTLLYSYNYQLIAADLSASTLWISAYAWIASDVTFIGSLFVLFFFGSLFARSWMKVTTMPTIVSSALLGWMAYFFFQINFTFVPADLGAVVSFWGVILMFVFRFKKNRRGMIGG